MTTFISRERQSKIFVVSETDDEGETWIDSAWHHQELAQRRIDKLEQDNGSGEPKAFMQELAWDWRADCFKVSADE